MMNEDAKVTVVDARDVYITKALEMLLELARGDTYPGSRRDLENKARETLAEWRVLRSRAAG